MWQVGVNLEVSQLVVANFDWACSGYVSIFHRLFEDKDEYRILDRIDSAAAFNRRLVEMFVMIDIVPEKRRLILNIVLVFQNVRVDVNNIYSVHHVKLLSDLDVLGISVDFQPLNRDNFSTLSDENYYTEENHGSLLTQPTAKAATKITQSFIIRLHKIFNCLNCFQTETKLNVAICQHL